jgi:hypothetical protein
MASEMSVVVSNRGCGGLGWDFWFFLEIGRRFHGSASRVLDV